MCSLTSALNLPIAEKCSNAVATALPVPFFHWFSEFTIPLFRHIFLHRWECVRIHIQCHRDLTMPENFLHYFGVHFHSEKDSCCAVSKVVEAHVRQANTYEKPPENFPQGARAIVVAQGVGKHQIFINPSTTNFAPLLFLLCFVAYENINNKDRQFNHSAAFCCLWF